MLVWTQIFTYNKWTCTNSNLSSRILFLNLWKTFVHFKYFNNQLQGYYCGRDDNKQSMNDYLIVEHLTSCFRYTTLEGEQPIQRSPAWIVSITPLSRMDYVLLTYFITLVMRVLSIPYIIYTTSTARCGDYLYVGTRIQKAYSSNLCLRTKDQVIFTS